ncbi:unnamed protein product [Parnassius mnemosyne]|uniref:Palmitoyltransferase n=1 Tax=Parnassius mnemosyne TaxID=213953 RepID=A0AAV1KJD1_9NEOP
MDKCCTSGETQRTHRRINGFEPPLNYHQISAWIIFIITAIINLLFVVQIQFFELKVISFTFYVILYISHIISHIIAILLDPAEEELRKREVNDIPEFDRSIHAHVIENGRCHLCNIYTSNKKTKHCGICNKCVYRFDHHCKWLNNCIGQRNYAVFIICVITSALIALLTACLCVTDVILFFTYPQLLSMQAQNFINCTSSIQSQDIVKFCKNSIAFLSLLLIIFISALAISCALIHLICFHVYIAILGLTTYEYIMTTGNEKAHRLKCYKISRAKRFHMGSTTKNNTISRKLNSPSNNIITPQSLQVPNDNNVANLMQILINKEINRARNLLFDKNKVHPQS